ncbi:MAG: hypothetical protein LBE20_02855 [Deltaproteobacteria bacterium]|jgi:hypothetical protein|nr:hypothetical protein [Deltaproteobacteria bacterium]
MNFLRFFVLSVVIVTGLSACSTFDSKSNFAAGQQIAIDVFAGRGFLSGTSYERYYLDNNVLWRECGNVTREDNKKSPDMLPAFAYHPNLKLTNTGKEILTDKEFDKIANVAVELFNDISTRDKEDLPEPESLFSLSNAGVFEIRITYNGNDKSLVTSLDGINEGKLIRQKTARNLFTLIRGVGPVICSSQTFFGIERR